MFNVLFGFFQEFLAAFAAFAGFAAMIQVGMCAAADAHGLKEQAGFSGGVFSLDHF